MSTFVLRLSGTKIAEVLASQGRRQDWLADQIGVSPATVNRWIRGTRMLDIAHAEKVASALGVDFYLLFELPIGNPMAGESVVSA